MKPRPRPLPTMPKGRRAHTGQIIERAKARGEIAGRYRSDVVADLIASYAWRHLLTNRLDEPEATIRKMVRYSCTA